MKSYGCHRSLTLRDTPLWQAAEPLTLAPFVNLAVESFMPPIRDQGALGACTAFAATGLYQFVYAKMGYHHWWEPAELYVYYNERQLMGTTGFDSGASVSTALQALEQYGCCAEHWWNYVDPTIRFVQKPPAEAYANAGHHLVLQAQVVPQDLVSLKTCLAQGYPVDIGFVVFASFEDPEAMATGDAPMPTPGEQRMGGHSVLLVGYDDRTQRFKFRNSWNTTYGQQGYGTLPYAYLIDPALSYDFHTVRTVS